MTATVINIDDYRQEKEPETPMEAGLKALKDNAKDTLKGIDPVDEYFKKHPFDINTMKNNYPLVRYFSGKSSNSSNIP